MKNNIIFSYFSGVWSELKKVSWPTFKEVINHTIIVIVSALIAIGITMAADYGLSKLVQYLIEQQ
jgi:preprotein translocase SecE subunit